MDIYDGIVVGGGPAGLSAAIYMARYNRSVVVLDHWRGRWRSHEVNENYLGFPKGIKASRLRELGRQQALRFGVEFRRVKATSIRKDGAAFEARAGRYKFRGRTVILATGVRDKLPDIGKTEEYWGKTLFWCITCDGYKVRDKRTVILGMNDDATIAALQFQNFTKDLAFLTNCPPDSDSCELTEAGRERLRKAGIPIYEGRIDHAQGTNGIMRAVLLEDGTRIEAESMFSELGCEPRVELAEELGVKLAKNGFIEADPEQRTNVKRVYAAGDVTRLFAHQIVTAASEGAGAGIAANYDLYEPEQRH